MSGRSDHVLACPPINLWMNEHVSIIDNIYYILCNLHYYQTHVSLQTFIITSIK